MTHDPDPNKAPIYDPARGAEIERERVAGQEVQRPTARQMMLTTLEHNVDQLLSSLRDIDLSAEKAQLKAVFAAIKGKL